MKRIASFAIAVITLLSAVSCSSASEKSNSTSNKAANVITDKSRIFKRSELPFPDKLNTPVFLRGQSFRFPINLIQ